MTTFSVIIPAYVDTAQDATYLDNAIKCILAQTYKDYEVIVVDDCSPMRLVVPPDVKVVRNGKNMGIGYTRQRGIEEAKGEFIAFCSHDDWWEPDFLKEMVKYTDEEQVLYGDFRIHYEGDGNKDAPCGERATMDEMIDWTWELADKCWTFSHWSCMVFPKNFFKRLPINKAIPIAEDFEWNLKAVHVFPFKHVPKFLSYARYHNKMSSAGANYATIDARIRTDVRKWLSSGEASKLYP